MGSIIFEWSKWHTLIEINKEDVENEEKIELDSVSNEEDDEYDSDID